MTYEIREDELEHFGVKGMKWGVRREPQKSTAEERRELYKNLDYDKPPKNFRKRRLALEKREYKEQEARRKSVQKETGVKYWKSFKGSTEQADNGLRFKKKYSDEEIHAARAQKRGEQQVLRSLADDYSKEGVKAYNKQFRKLDDTKEETIANFKTTGERRIAFLLGGPIGLYRSSNRKSQVIRRATSGSKKGYGATAVILESKRQREKALKKNPV